MKTTLPTLESLRQELADLKANMPHWRDIPARTAYAWRKSELETDIKNMEHPIPIWDLSEGQAIARSAVQSPAERIQTYRKRAERLIGLMLAAPDPVTFSTKRSQLYNLKAEFRAYLLEAKVTAPGLPDAPANPWSKK